MYIAHNLTTPEDSLMRNIQFTDSDKGCYIDGSFGLDHVCAKLRNLIGDCVQPYSKALGSHRGADIDTISDLQLALDKGADGLADDHSEIEMATDFLTIACPDNLYFIWSDGDLLLVDTLEWELEQQA